MLPPNELTRWGLTGQVQELLGHSSVMLTLDTYSHVAPALHAEVALKMGALFNLPDTAESR